MPTEGKRVLVWDEKLKIWKIGRIEDRLGEKWWVFDPHMYYACDDRFKRWVDLPGDLT